MSNGDAIGETEKCACFEFSPPFRRAGAPTLHDNLLRMKQEDYLKRIELARRKLDGVSGDCLAVTPSTNLFYLSGIRFDRSERLTAVLIPKNGDPVLIVPAFEEARARAMTPIKHVVAWEETENPFRIAARHLGASTGTLLLEPTTAYDDAERLIAEAPQWKPKSAAALFASLRMVKSADEISAMRRATVVGSERFQNAFARLKPGVSEDEVSAAFGGENVVQFGPSAAIPHGRATQRTLSKNEAVLIDAWDNPEGYFYDITRSTFYGTPTEEYIRVWNVVHEAQGAAIALAAPGVRCEEVDAAARAVIQKGGYADYFTHRLGHGLGLDVHEPPYMVAGNDIVLEPGMAFTSEPGIYLPGKFGVRIEDDIIVTRNGSEILSPRPQRLEPIPA